MNPTEVPDNKTSTEKPAAKRKGLYLIIAITIGLILLSRREPMETIDCTPEIIAAGPDVIMLGAWWCSYCYQAKKYFQHNNINYCEYDMESTETGRQLYQQHGGGAIPIILIGGYQLSGFNQRQIERALELLHKDTDNGNSD